MLPVPTEENTVEKTYMDHIAVLRKMKQDKKGRTKRDEKKINDGNVLWNNDFGKS